jgi:hypothetical protein
MNITPQQGTTMRRLVSALVILASAASFHVVHADDSPARTPELEVLNRFIGTWDIRDSATIGDNDPVESIGVETRRCSTGGSVIEFENANPPEFHMLLTYHADSDKYVGVLMSGPGRGTVVADWDADAETMSFVVELTDGSRYEGTNRFIDEGHIESQGTVTGADGRVMVELSMDQTRR